MTFGANSRAADVVTVGRPIGKTLKKLTDVAEDLLKDLAKCCLKPCDLPKIPQKRGIGEEMIGINIQAGDLVIRKRET